MRCFRYSRLQSSLRLAMSPTRLEEEKKNEFFPNDFVSNFTAPKRLAAALHVVALSCYAIFTAIGTKYLPSHEKKLMFSVRR